ncbi:hypothetical protein HPB47_025219 [Ixodes persulcatus]|uniref:Uncharacterized protein n=1 Tax=Ixodes persulcatus TaxID=34615 RepID=A0AC60Q2M7_IXOPE|nr:hypothetical protein HPB47_025219 [Ixodes persulcatus]
MENQALKEETKTAYGNVDLKNDSEVEFFTGLPSSGMFWALLHYILALYTPNFSAKMPHWSQLLMVLMKLRLGLLNKDLSSSVCGLWIQLARGHHLQELCTWRVFLQE